mgnify:CR=1 FL=1
MKYKVVQVVPFRHKIYDIDGDFFFPKNFVKAQTAREYIYRTILDPALAKKPRKMVYHKKVQTLDFN